MITYTRQELNTEHIAMNVMIHAIHQPERNLKKVLFPDRRPVVGEFLYRSHFTAFGPFHIRYTIRYHVIDSFDAVSMPDEYMIGMSVDEVVLYDDIDEFERARLTTLTDKRGIHNN